MGRAFAVLRIFMGLDWGEQRPQSDLPFELTITADGAFWGPFRPSVNGGKPDTDLLTTRTTPPLSVPARALLSLVENWSEGAAPRSLSVERDPLRPVRALRHPIMLTNVPACSVAIHQPCPLRLHSRRRP